ncbi:sensor histidine kinase [Brachybacterium sp. GCM10030267]|uniref:sensor histidine kinase n=1 Tax=Brachybacterium sp. GCM10030267 TaxID=3273381 RepID=UPI00361ED348
MPPSVPSTSASSAADPPDPGASSAGFSNPNPTGPSPSPRRALPPWADGLVTTPAAGPRPRDALLLIPFTLIALAEGMLRTDLPLPALTTAAAIAMIAGLPWRRRHPLLVLTWITLLGAVLGIVQAASVHVAVGMGAMVVLLTVPYALFRHGTARMRVVGGTLLAAGQALTLLQSRAALADVVVGIAVLGATALSGALVRERVQARAREIEMARSREREALARDLHDTVAHHVTTIAIRAQVASAMPEDRNQVAESLAVIEREAQNVLAETRALVRALREPTGGSGATGSAAAGAAASDPMPADVDLPETELAPAAGLAQLEALADPGPPQVTVRITGTDQLAGEMPQIVQSTLFRIAQEGVTNARRHARGARAIDVRVSVRDARTVLEVRDDGPRDVAPHRADGSGGGHGLLGMTERVTLLGGTLEAGPVPDGGWLLRAQVPTTPEAA